jgi:hypothetical protein
MPAILPPRQDGGKADLQDGDRHRHHASSQKGIDIAETEFAFRLSSLEEIGLISLILPRPTLACAAFG